MLLAVRAEMVSASSLCGPGRQSPRMEKVTSKAESTAGRLGPVQLARCIGGLGRAPEPGGLDLIGPGRSALAPTVLKASED